MEPPAVGSLSEARVAVWGLQLESEVGNGGVSLVGGTLHLWNLKLSLERWCQNGGEFSDTCWCMKIGVCGDPPNIGIGSRNPKNVTITSLGG